MTVMNVENPGFPFFIPGVAGTRAPHPPLDFAPDGSGGLLPAYGGLPRHVVTRRHGSTIRSYEKSRSRPGEPTTGVRTLGHDERHDNCPKKEPASKRSR